MPAADAEQVGDGAGPAVGEQDGVDALFQAGAVADEMEPPARPLPLGPDHWVGQPDRRHEVTAAELGQHPGVDPVGPAGERRQPLHLLRISDLDPPAGQLEPVMDEAGAVHRLDRRPHLLSVTTEALGQATQTVSVWRRRTSLDRDTVSVEQTEIEALATEIQTGVQHEVGPPLDSSRMTNRSLSLGEALLHCIPYHRATKREPRV